MATEKVEEAAKKVTKNFTESAGKIWSWTWATTKGVSLAIGLTATAGVLLGGGSTALAAAAASGSKFGLTDIFGLCKEGIQESLAMFAGGAGKVSKYLGGAKEEALASAFNGASGGGFMNIASSFASPALAVV